LLNWGLSRGYCVIPKATSIEHQMDNFAALDFSLSADEVKQITALDEGKQLFSHTPDVKYNVYA
jgi:2,5-diketo-D-gluconate reductase A